LILGRTGKQSVLNTIAQLTQNIFMHIRGVLSDEIAPTPFDLINRPTCSTSYTNDLGASSNNKGTSL
jgi:hypothetical protein